VTARRYAAGVRVRVVWWDLEGAGATIAQLREYLRDESVDAFGSVPGLRLKLWITDEATNRWGAIYLWESREASRQKLPSRARELIGKDPDFEEWFDLEASVEGAFTEAMLARRGLAFDAA
jgi:hypothetical protein